MSTERDDLTLAADMLDAEEVRSSLGLDGRDGLDCKFRVVEVTKTDKRGTKYVVDEEVPYTEEMLAEDIAEHDAFLQRLRESGAVLAAAETWVERIGDHPNLWADTEDHALIAAVKARNGKSYPWEETHG